jgi:hypothetical protein
MIAVSALLVCAVNDGESFVRYAVIVRYIMNICTVLLNYLLARTRGEEDC